MPPLFLQMIPSLKAEWVSSRTSQDWAIPLDPVTCEGEDLPDPEALVVPLIHGGKDPRQQGFDFAPGLILPLSFEHWFPCPLEHKEQDFLKKSLQFPGGFAISLRCITFLF